MERTAFSTCMEALNHNLSTKGIYAEVTLNHGIMQHKLFNAKERTTPVDALFIHESELHKATEEVAQSPQIRNLALPNNWLEESLRAHLTAPVSLSNLNIIRFPLITVKKEAVFVIKAVEEAPARRAFSIDDIPLGEAAPDIERSAT